MPLALTIACIPLAQPGAPMTIVFNDAYAYDTM